MRHLRKLLVGAALCASLATVSGAQASTTLFSDTFDGENGGASALNYTGFANWTVTGQVDLVRQPNYGIGCQDGGSCVDLDGTAGPGAMFSKLINFDAGDRLLVSFDLSGNQRNGNSDSFDFALLFAAPTDVSGLTTLTGFPGSPVLLGSQPNLTSVSYSPIVAGNSPWTRYSLEFTAVEAGAFQFRFATSSADNIGPLIDNVSVAAIPEPATWALMIGGFGLAGAALRRRRVAMATA